MIMSFEFQIWQHTKFSAQKEYISKQETEVRPLFLFTITYMVWVH